MAGGEQATASYTIRNAGKSAVRDSVIFLLEQNTPTPGAGDIDIHPSSTTRTLAAGKTATETVEFELPQNLSGTYYLVGEITLSNYFASSAIDVNGQTPNLAISFNASSIPASTSFGSKLTPQLQITNTGTAEGAGQELTLYFLSTSNDPNQDLSGSGVYYLGSSTEPIDLTPSQSATESASLTLPNTASIPPGTYYLVAHANDGSPPIADPIANNPVAVSSAISITASAAGVASVLMPTLPHTTLPASVLSSKSTPANATVLLQNSGSVVYSGSTHVTLYMSQSSTLDSTATAVSGVVRNLRIPAHKSVALVVRLGAVPAIDNGAY
jgi:hypothetical protein